MEANIEKDMNEDKLLHLLIKQKGKESKLLVIMSKCLLDRLRTGIDRFHN